MEIPNLKQVNLFSKCYRVTLMVKHIRAFGYQTNINAHVESANRTVINLMLTMLYS